MSNKKINKYYKYLFLRYKKTKIIFLLLLFSALVVIKEVAINAEEIVNENIMEEEVVKEKPGYADEGRRNPFVPLVTNDGILTHLSDESGDSVLYLQGIFYDEGGESMALINDEAVRKNDLIGNSKIVEIRRNSVVYTKNGEIFILNLFGEGEE